MGKGLAGWLALGLLAMPPGVRAQADDAGVQHPAQAMDVTGEKNAAQARAALDAMVKALGGDAWLNLKNVVREGHIAAFFHGEPDWARPCFGSFTCGPIMIGWSIRSTAMWCSFMWGARGLK